MRAWMPIARGRSPVRADLALFASCIALLVRTSQNSAPSMLTSSRPTSGSSTPFGNHVSVAVDHSASLRAGSSTKRALPVTET